MRHVIRQPARKNRSKRGIVNIVIVVLITTLGINLWWSQPAAADQLDPRSLTIASSTASANTRHTFSFRFPTSHVVGSIQIEFCDTPLLSMPCVPVPGLDASGAALVGLAGEAGFSVLTTGPNSIIMTRPPVATTGALSTYIFDGMVNPSIVGQFYARITAYTSTNATGPYTDYGGVAASTAAGMTTQLFVPPILIFCVAVQIPNLDCSSGTGDFLQLGQLSSKSVRAATSQMLIATNAFSGYAITVDGITMSAGTKTIPALDAPAASAPGVSQFGMNLVANGNPAIGSNPAGPGAGYVLGANYAISNRYAYENGDVVVFGPSVTDYKRFTSSYIVNVAADQAPGIYTTTLTYTATASF
jgi:hypothetical protein